MNYPNKKHDKDDLCFTSKFGRYLISSFNTWHGGIHIEGDKEVNAIADGRIIAYRFNDAYQVLENLSEEKLNAENPDDYPDFSYSNNFILMQHDVELNKEEKKTKKTKNSEGKIVEEEEIVETKRRFTYYSLYNHLSVLDEYSKGVTKLGVQIPEIFRKQTGKVILKEGFLGEEKKVSGLNARQPNAKTGNIYPIKNSIKKFVIPTGKVVKKYKNKNDEYDIIQTNYIRVVYTDHNSDKHDDIYINKKSSFVKENKEDESFEIIHSGDHGVITDNSSLTSEKKKIKGARLRDKTKGGKIIDIIPFGEEVEFLSIDDIQEKEGKDGTKYIIYWAKIKWKVKEEVDKYETGYCHSSNFEATIDFDEKKITRNAIKACDIAVKSGEKIGYTGYVESRASGCDYKALHLEVFMTKDAPDFITNKFKPEKEEEKKYFVIPEDTQLYQTLESSLDSPLKKDTIVTIVQDFSEDDKYVKIKVALEDHVTTVKTEGIIYTPDKDSKYDTDDRYEGYTSENGYHIINFTKLNEAFGGVLKEGISKVFYESVPKDKGSREVKSPNLLSGKEFWIEHKHLAEVKDYKIEKNLRKAPKSVLKATSFTDYIFNKDARFVMVSSDEKVERYDTVTYMDGNNDIIELEDKIIAIVPKSLIKWKSGHYVARATSFDAVNNCFANELLNDSAKLYPVKGETYVKEDGTIDNRKNSEGNRIAKYRKVYYKLREHYKEIEYENRKVENGTRDARSKEKTKLLSEVKKVYWVLPDNKKDTAPIQTCNDAIINVNDSKEITTTEGVFKSVICKQIVDSETGTYVQEGWVEASVIDEEKFFSAYNWDKFGFKIIEDGGDEYMYVVQDYLGEENSESEFVNALWYQMDQNNSMVISDHEITMAYKSKEFQNYVSKIVCKHKNEWSYTKEEIRKEVDGFYDYFITEQPAEYRGEMDELKTGELDAIDGQVEKLMFWQEASAKTYEPPPPTVDEPEVTNTNSSLDFRGEVAEEPTTPSNNLETVETAEERTTPSNNLETVERAEEPTTPPNNLETAEESDTTEVSEEEETVPRIFPSTENVHHFHPIAFINHMKLIFGGSVTADYCIQEMKVRAFLRLIKHKEGEIGEEGYKQLVGGGSFNDFSKHPKPHVWIERIKDFSSASGAYQINVETWESSPLTSSIKKKHDIKDFSQLSQDYAALVLLKYKKKGVVPTKSQVKEWGENWADKMVKHHKKKFPSATRKSYPKYVKRYENATGDIIQMLIDNDLDKALLTAAVTWASFPDSVDGQELSIYTIKKAKIEFRKLLLEEIKGETDLHLETGFLKKFGYDCCSGQNNAITGTSPSGKEAIDLRPTVPWQTQFCAFTWGPKYHQRKRCYDTSLMILNEFVGLGGAGSRGGKTTTVQGRNLGLSDNVIQIALEENEVNGRYTETNPVIANFQKGIDYLDQELEKGNPVIVGLSHTYNLINPTKKQLEDGLKGELNHDKSSDHYVIVLGRGYENGKRYFLYYEVGTSDSAKGQHDNNRLYVNKNTITGTPPNNATRIYTVTQIRGNKTAGDFT